MRLLNVPYNIWSMATANNDFVVYHQIQSSDVRQAWSGNRDFIFYCNVTADDFSDYSENYEEGATIVATEDEAIAQIIGLSPRDLAIAPTDDKNRPYATMWPTEGSRKTIVSHSWCAPTTWAEKSEQVLQETPSETTTLTVYQLDNPNIINVYHGKIWDEDSMSQYRVLVETSTNGTDWTTKTEEDPHEKHISEEAHGDYVLDYTSGILTFHNQLPADSQVRVSYHYATSSVFTITPTVGKALKLRKAEVQFSQNIELRDTTVFETYGYVDVFAPQLVNNIDPDYQTSFPSGTKIPLGNTSYKTMRDFYNEANGAMPVYPALGGNNWRGLQHPVVVMQWDYAALLTLSSAAGMEVRIYLEHDEPFAGEYATATVYGLSEDE